MYFLSKDLLEEISRDGMSQIFGGVSEPDDGDKEIDNGRNCDDSRVICFICRPPPKQCGRG